MVFINTKQLLTFFGIFCAMTLFYLWFVFDLTPSKVLKIISRESRTSTEETVVKKDKDKDK
ncbi:hypothetical protein ATP_00058 [Candidatus Phytoplasma mali]|uniref:Uncharacterized protein n=1 Tax=Phytoplasma mali (strain AT) TaxID=482235 RepID=B3R081_PHYMT|nr:hypothetical protein [Candidatus Phytoplasma mali]CAP18245.1 hypothetical protein ATP_00058 [Candidatus Phytoplasma mali]